MRPRVKVNPLAKVHGAHPISSRATVSPTTATRRGTAADATAMSTARVIDPRCHDT